MNRQGARALCCAVAVLLLACSQKAERDQAAAQTESVARGRLAVPATAAAPAFAGVAALKAMAPPEAPLRRHLAVRHELQIVTEADAIEAAWRAASEACAAAGCEVLASTLTRDDERRPAQASLEARLPPETFDAFLKQVTALDSVGHHSKTAEDKTDEVIDTDARLKNMGDFRDSLRRLLATPGAKLKDLVEVERELVRVQSELDSLASRRKSLASQTERVHVMLNFSPRPAVLELGMWSPVRDAVLRAGHVFAGSLGGLIASVVALLPWGVALALLGFVLRPLWRRWRARRNAGQAPTARA